MFFLQFKQKKWNYTKNLQKRKETYLKKLKEKKQLKKAKKTVSEMFFFNKSK